MDNTNTRDAGNSRWTLGIPGAIVVGSTVIATSIFFGLTTGDLSARGAQSGIGPAAAGGTGLTETQVEAAPVDVDKGDLPILGDPDAPVLLVQWSDYQCPYCKKMFEGVEAQIMSEYVETGRVAFAYRDYAFLGHESTDASSAARCANEQGKFWEYRDRLFSEHPGTGHGNHLGSSELERYAEELGLDTELFSDCMESEKYVEAIEADTRAGQEAGVLGTPTTFVNGRILSGALPFSSFEKLIEEELSDS